MSKLRFLSIIIIALYIIFVFPLQILGYVDITIFILIGLTLMIIYYFIWKNENKKLTNISKIYLHGCDPIKYIDEYQKFLKNSITNKNSQILNKITISLAYISSGDAEEARKILDSLVDLEPKFDLNIRFWYYKAWIYYFEEIKEIERIKILIKQAKLLIDDCPLKYKAQLISNYNQIIARYYVLSNIHLELAEEEFKKIFKGNFPKFNVVVNVYYLGVISYKQRDYQNALEYFNSVIKNGNKLAVVNKAKTYIENIQNEINEN